MADIDESAHSPARVRTAVIDVSRRIVVRRGHVARVAPIFLGSLVAIGVLLVLASFVLAASQRRSPLWVYEDDGEFLVSAFVVPLPVEAMDQLIALEGVPVGSTRASLRATLVQLGRRESYTAEFVRPTTGATIQATFHPLPPARMAGLAGVLDQALLTLIAALGLLVLRSDSEMSGKREFVLLSASTSLALISTIHDTWEEFTDPLPGLFTGSYTALGDLDAMFGVFVWPTLVALFLARFLATASAQQSVGVHWLFGWHVLLVLIGGVSVGGVALVLAGFFDEFFLVMGLGAGMYVLAPLVMGNGLAGVLIRNAIGWASVMGVLHLLPRKEDSTFWELVPAAPTSTAEGLGLMLLGMTILAFVRWPLAVYRLARLGRRRGGVGGRQIDVVMAGIRVGVLSFIGFLCVVGGGVTLMLNRVWAQKGFFAEDSPTMIAFTFLATALAVAALASPFVGVFLAVTRHGLWNADLLFRRIAVVSGLGAFFLIFWETTGLLIGSMTEGVADTLAAPLVAAVGLAVVRPRIERRIEQLVFPVNQEVPEQVRRIVLAAQSADFVLREEELHSIRASSAVVVRGVSSNWAVARRVGDTIEPIGVAAVTATDTLTRHQRAVLVDGASVRFAYRIKLADDGFAIVLLEPARGSRLYDERDNQELHFLFQVLAPRLAVHCEADLAFAVT